MNFLTRNPQHSLGRFFRLLSCLLIAAAAISIFLVLAPAAFAGPGPWVSHGPSAANVEKNIVVSPNYSTDHTVFVPTMGGGMFKSTDSGASWSPVSGGLMSYYVWSADISPNYATDHTVFAGTWGSGVFKSTNGGGMWSPVNNGITGFGMTGIAISPAYASDNTVFATSTSSNGGVFKSTDGGASWNPSNTGLTDLAVQDIAISANFASDHTLVVGTENDGVFISTDGGGTWNAMNTGITDTRMSAVAISPNFAADHTLLAGGQSGIYVSTDGGTNWGLTNFQGFTDSIKFSPNFASDNVAFAGSSNHLQKSTDGGSSWSIANTGVDTVKDPAIGISPGFASDHTVFLGTFGIGVYKSTDSGGSWNAANSGLISSQIESIAPSPSYATDGTVFAGVNGGGVYKSTDSGLTWNPAYSGLPMGTSFVALATSPNYGADSTVFVSTQGAGVYRSVNGGASWSGSFAGISGKIIFSIAVSPNFASDNTLFAGGTSGQLFKSTDRGTHWSPANSGIGSYDVKALALSPNFASDHTLFAGTNGGGLYVSTDGGDSWNPSPNGYSNYINAIAVSPNFVLDHTLFAAASNSVQKSADAAASWSPVNTGGSGGVMSIALSPGFASDGNIYILQGYKPRESTDGGATWQQVGTTDLTLCQPQTLSLAPQYGNNYSLFLAGYGTGVLEYNLIHSSYWTWYDDANADDWILLGQPGSASANDFFSLSIGGQMMDISGFSNGLVTPGNTIYPNYGGMIGGPVKASSMNGTKGILSQRILWPKGGNSLEEVPATDESKLSDHFWWTWYDESSLGYDDWVLVANPNTTPVYYEIKIAGQDPGAGSSGTIAPGQNVTPNFKGVIGGPVEVQAWTDSGKSQPANVLASQRVLSNGGGAFNEVPGMADPTGGGASDLSHDYYWTWYDNKSAGAADWVLIANKDAAANMYYEIDINGLTVATDETGTADVPAGPILPGSNITPVFNEQGGPVRVRTFADEAHAVPMDSIASQRVLWGPSFEEVPGLAESKITTDYLWTWYDENQGPGVQNWVLVANTNAIPIYYEITIGGALVASGNLDEGKSATPDFPNHIGGPVEVRAWIYSDKVHTVPVMASQRVIWRGYFNEVLGSTP